jgi:hypothetical protein
MQDLEDCLVDVYLHGGDLGLSGRTAPAEDLLELVDGGGALEERLTPDYLAYHAAQAPDVNLFGVGVTA